MSQKSTTTLPKTPEEFQAIAREFRSVWTWNAIELDKYGPESVSERLKIFLEKFLGTHIISLKQDSPEFKRAVEKIFKKISQSKNFDKNNVHTAIITSGLLIITNKDGKEISFNLMDLWRESFMDFKKRLIGQKVREEERKLQDIVAKESFYNGSVILEYSLGGATMASGGILLAKPASKAIQTTQYIVKSIFMPDKSGMNQRIHLREAFVGTLADFRDSIGRIIKHVWLEYDPVTKSVFSPAKKMLQSLGKDLVNLKYEDYKKTPEGKGMTREQFEEFKRNALKKQNSLLNGIINGSVTSRQVATFVRSIIKESMVFFPLIASEYHHSQSAHSLLNAATNEAMFYAGAKVGAKAGKGVYKMGGVLIGWTLGVLAGKTGLEYIDARRQVWLHTQKMNYRDERSGFLHGTSLFLTEITAWVNWAGRKISGDKNYTWIDVGSDKMHAINPITGNKLFTVPEFTLYQDKVTMATKPWEWINASVVRDVTDWNRYVDRYKIEVTKNIYDILGKYHRNESIFGDKWEITKAGGRDELLAKELKELLSGDNSGQVFENEMLNMISNIVIESSKPKPMSIPNSLINEYIHTGIGAMKIDTTLFVKDRHEKMVSTRWEIDNIVFEIPNLTIEQKKFLQQIPDRMLANKDLHQNNEEKLIYEYLLNRKDTISIRWQKISVGNYIAFWLDRVVEWKRETAFLSEIKSWRSGRSTWTSF